MSAKKTITKKSTAKKSTARKSAVKKKVLLKKNLAPQAEFNQTRADLLFVKGRNRGFLTENEVLYGLGEIEDFPDEYEEFLDHIEGYGIGVI